METIIWQWGPFSVPVFSLTFFIAVVIFLIKFFAEGKARRLSDQEMIDFVIVAFAGGLAGSRLAYAVLFDFGYYLENPARLLWLQDGGMSLWGGLLAALLALFFWSARKHVIIECYLDAAAPAFALSLAIGNTGALLRGKLMASPYPWAIEYAGKYYHPDGAYMIVLLLVLFFILRWRKAKRAFEGELFIWFLVGYSLLSIAVDFFRESEPFLWHFTAGQAASLAAILLAFFYLLVGSKIYTSFGYSTYRFSHVKRSWIGSFFRAVLAVAFIGLMVALYYLARQPFPFNW